VFYHAWLSTYLFILQLLMNECQHFVFLFQSSGSGSVSSIGGMKLESVPSTKQKVYQNMFEHMGLGDHTVVANLIVTKIGKNLKFWPDDHDIVSKTLELLTDIASGYSSSKLLLTLDTVKYLVSHHTHEEFPFLNVSSNARHRTTFHAILVRLLLSPGGEEKLGLDFDQFMEPIIKVMSQLGALDSSQLRSEAARQPLIGVFRDLRGVAISLHNRKAYGMMFDILEPHHMPLLSKVADLWYDQPDVIISLLRFMQEFCHNKANRVNFDQSSPNGILLFRATSDVVCAFGRRILANTATPAGDVYKLRYKGISIALSVLNSALGGNYVCFGVFALYNDPALDNALDISLKLALSIPLDHVIAYPKLSKSVFSFIEIMFRNHNKTTMALDTSVFMQLMNAVHEGLQSSDAQIGSTCANSIDHLATFYYENNGKDKPEVHNLNKVGYRSYAIGIVFSSDSISLTVSITSSLTAFGGTTQSIFQSYSYSLQSTTIWSTAKSLGGHATHAQFNAG
jgi:exportin-7